MMNQFGLLGRKLSHSYSPQIHALLGDYLYPLYEREEDEVENFLKNSAWNGINVTIPYKRTVMKFLDRVSDEAKLVGGVNTVVREKDGSLSGYNTDVYGFTELFKHSGIEIDGKKVLVLGSGGASAAVTVAVKKLGGTPVVISRSGENNYENIAIHSDASVIVNATPVGMYPKNSVSPIDLRVFPKCEGVLDLIYNPSVTEFLFQARELKIKNENGLYMLVAQAKKSAELFTGNEIADAETERIFKIIAADLRNIVLIGMPSCGKSTVGEKIGKFTGHEFIDADIEFLKKYGETPEKVITEKGEAQFRTLESELLAELGKLSGKVIATGGGCVTRDENFKHLKQNAVTVWIKRDLKYLTDENRPISKQRGAEALFKERAPLYEKFADISFDSDGDVNSLLKMLSEVNI